MTTRSAWWALPRRASLAGVLLAMPGMASSDASAVQRCKPRRPLPAVIARRMGPCGFDPATASFAGDAIRQAACRLRPVGRRARLGPPLEALPPVLAARLGADNNLPAREMVGA